MVRGDEELSNGSQSISIGAILIYLLKSYLVMRLKDANAKMGKLLGL